MNEIEAFLKVIAELLGLLIILILVTRYQSYLFEKALERHEKSEAEK